MITIDQIKALRVKYRQYIDHYLSDKYNEYTRERICNDIISLVRNDIIKSVIFAAVDKSDYKISSGVKITIQKGKPNKGENEFPDIKYNSFQNDMILIAELMDSNGDKGKGEKQEFSINDLKSSWNYLAEPEMKLTDIKLGINE